MKNSIIYLGITLFTFLNAKSETTEKLQSIQNINLEIVKGENLAKDYSVVKANFFNNESKGQNINTFPKPLIEKENIISNLEDLVFIEKSIEEIIAADNEITDNKIDKTVRPIYIEDFIENTIIENNKIIESNSSNEYYPLDFDIINKTHIVTIGNRVNWVD